jgi:hypothetical protein
MNIASIIEQFREPFCASTAISCCRGNYEPWTPSLPVKPAVVISPAVAVTVSTPNPMR